MSIQFVRGSKDDVAATLALSFALTSKFISVEDGSNLSAFLLASSGVALFLSLLWRGIAIVLLGYLDRQAGYELIGSYQYAWSHVNYDNTRVRIVSNMRYFIAAVILIDVPHFWGEKPFIYNWYIDYNFLIRALLVGISAMTILFLLRDKDPAIRNLKTVRVTNALEAKDANLQGLMQTDRWEEINFIYNEKLAFMNSLTAQIKDQIYDQFNFLNNFSLDKIYLQYFLNHNKSTTRVETALNNSNDILKRFIEGTGKSIPVNNEYLGKKFKELALTLNELFNEEMTISEELKDLSIIQSEIETVSKFFDILNSKVLSSGRVRYLELQNQEREVLGLNLDNKAASNFHNNVQYGINGKVSSRRLSIISLIAFDPQNGGFINVGTERSFVLNLKSMVSKILEFMERDFKNIIDMSPTNKQRREELQNHYHRELGEEKLEIIRSAHELFTADPPIVRKQVNEVKKLLKRFEGRLNEINQLLDTAVEFCYDLL